jgi:hypothetical protein
MFVHRVVDRYQFPEALLSGLRPARCPMSRNTPMNPGIGTCIFSLLRKQLAKTGIREDKYELWETVKLSLLPVRSNERSPGGISLILSGLLEDSADVNAGRVVCVGCDCACESPLPVCSIHSASLINEVVIGEGSFTAYAVAVTSCAQSTCTGTKP